MLAWDKASFRPGPSGIAPAWTVLACLLFLDETVTPWMLLCAGVIVCGNALSAGLLRLPQPSKARSA